MPSRAAASCKWSLERSRTLQPPLFARPDHCSDETGDPVRTMIEAVHLRAEIARPLLVGRSLGEHPLEPPLSDSLAGGDALGQFLIGSEMLYVPAGSLALPNERLASFLATHGA